MPTQVLIKHAYGSLLFCFPIQQLEFNKHHIPDPVRHIGTPQRPAAGVCPLGPPNHRRAEKPQEAHVACFIQPEAPLNPELCGHNCHANASEPIGGVTQ